MVSRKSAGKTPARSEPVHANGHGNGEAAGLDLGTSTVVTARRNGGGFRSAAELNAFIDLPPSRFTEQILAQNDIDYVREGRRIVVYGNGAAKFANMFNAETRRPMRHGLVNATEPHAHKLLKVIVKKLLGKNSKGSLVCFSVPGAPLSAPTSLVYHEALMKQMIEGMGYEAKSINEGLAVVFSELEKENFSGIGISFGGGLTNVALAYLSVPVFAFAIEKGGDDIDEAVGKVTGETATRVRTIKEEGLDLNRRARSKIEGALQIYYQDLINTVVQGIEDALARTERMPKLDSPLPVVLAGGSALPKGFKLKFERALMAQNLPIPLAGVRMGKEPLTATARGALLAALYEN
jgi:actin-like ATPase involved in cell morphogenesis